MFKGKCLNIKMRSRGSDLVREVQHKKKLASGTLWRLISQAKMRRTAKEGKISRNRSSPSSPFRDRTRTTVSSSGLDPTSRGSSPNKSRLTPSTSLLDSELVTENATTLFEDLRISPESNPRSFPYSVKQQCWDKSEKVRGRDPERWRRDALGNIVFRKLVGCPGCLCHDYDHILPYSKVHEFQTSSWVLFIYLFLVRG